MAQTASLPDDLRVGGPRSGLGSTAFSQVELGAAALCVAALLVPILPAGVAFFDSGELAAAAARLGVPHPTGFPLFVLVGHLLTALPLASAITRIHLVGTLAACVASALWLGVVIGRDHPLWRQLAPWARALLLPALVLLPLVGSATLLHMRATEVYPLVWLVAAVAVVIAAAPTSGGRFVALTMTAALAVGVHVEAALVVAVVATLVVLRNLRAARVPRFDLRKWVGPVIVGSLGLLAVAYLPLAAARVPGLSWGDVRSWDALINHLMATSIRRAFADAMGADGARAGVEMLGSLVWRDSGRWLPAAAIGAIALARSNPRALGLTVGVGLTEAAYAIFVNPMGLRDDQVGMLVTLAIGVLAARGLVEIVAAIVTAHGAPADQTRGRARPSIAGFAVAACLVLVGESLAGALSSRPTAQLDAGARMADHWLANARPGGLLVSSSDPASGACTWMQVGEGARPDVTCVPGVFGRDPRMLRWLQLRTGDASFGEALVLARRARNAADEALVLGAWLRPAWLEDRVDWELGNAFEDAQVSSRLLPGFPWHHLALDAVSDDAFRAALGNSVVALERWCADPQGGAGCPAGSLLGGYLGHELGLLGVVALRRGLPEARAVFERAMTLAPADPPLLNNLAVLRIREGDGAAARALCERALALRPDYRRAWRTLSRAALLEGDHPAVLEAARRYIGERPGPARSGWLADLATEVERSGRRELASGLRSLAPRSDSALQR